jgi:hypothetical protein
MSAHPAGVPAGRAGFHRESTLEVEPSSQRLQIPSFVDTTSRCLRRETRAMTAKADIAAGNGVIPVVDTMMVPK